MVLATRKIDKDTPYLTGWLAPDGTFYPCQSCNHYDVAQEILREVFSDEISDPHEKLYNRRFVHISTDCSCDMGWLDNKRPSSAQIRILWDLHTQADSDAMRCNLKIFIERHD